MHNSRILFLFLLTFCGLLQLVNAQAPEIEWDRTYGGEGVENITNVFPLADGDFMIFGESASKTSEFKEGEKIGGYDYWFVEVDKSGTKKGDKTFGGKGHDKLKEVIQTKDGFLLAGNSPSDANEKGEKSENSKGSDDYWVVKLNSDGSKAWDRTLGGDGNDFLSSVIQTSDGGYLLAGHSNSSDESEDKSESSVGYDYWVIKLNSRGIREWDKTFNRLSNDLLKSFLLETTDGFIVAGTPTAIWEVQEGNGFGTVKEHLDYWVAKVSKDNGTELWSKTYGGLGTDELASILPAKDGFLLAGTSDSFAEERKTEGTRGRKDYWVVKIDGNGKKEWDKSFGGENNDILKEVVRIEDGYILAGTSSSNPDESGGKSEANHGEGDYWVVKVSPEGGKQWDRTFGGSAADTLRTIIPTTDGFLLAGSSSSTSNLQGGKSENGRGNIDYWVVEINKSGKKLWDKTLGGNDIDFLRPVLQTKDGGYLLAGHSASSNVSGDKSDPNRGIHDLWVVKLSPKVPSEPAILSVETASEASEDGKNGSFELKLSRPLSETISIQYDLSGTATENDYKSHEGSVEISAGKTSVSIIIEVKDDDLIEWDETVKITLLDKSSEEVEIAESPENEAELLIINNDTEIVRASKVQDTSEGSGEAGKFEITLDKALDFGINVGFSLTGTAVNGDDYYFNEGHIYIDAGEVSAIISIDAEVDDDSGDETVILSLSQTDHPYVLVEEGDHEMFISDAAPYYTLSVYPGEHAVEGEKQGSFKFELGNTFGHDIIVEYTLSGTAENGKDYETEGSVTIPAHEDTYELLVTALPDTLQDEDEKIILDISNIISDEEIQKDPRASQAEITIKDKEVIFLSLTKGKDAKEDKENGKFVISSSAALPHNITIHYTFSGSTAVPGKDFTSPEGNKVIMTAGSQTVEVVISVTPDTQPEGDETVVMTLSGREDYILLNKDASTATLKIEDDEACFNITHSIQHAGCEDASNGGIDIQVEGASEEITFIWSNGVKVEDLKNVPSGTYKLEVKDNKTGCNVIREFVVESVDKDPPVVRTRSVTIQLDAGGKGNLSAIDLNNGSSDNCGIEAYSADKTTFSCSDIGENQVIITVEDINGNKASANATVFVEDNLIPVLEKDQEFLIPEDAQVNLVIGTVKANDNCKLQNWQILEGNEEGFFKIDDTGQISIQSKPASGVAAFSVKVQVSDGFSQVSEVITFKVTEENSKGPSASTSVNDQKVKEDDFFDFTIPLETFSYGKPEELVYSLHGQPGWLTFESLSLHCEGNPVNEDVGVYQVIIRATDGQGRFAEQPFTVEVINTNDAPHNLILSGNKLKENQPEGTIVGDLIPEDVDVGDQHTFKMAAGPGDTHNQFFELQNSNLLSTWVPDYEKDSLLTIRLAVTDNAGAVFEQVFEIKILDEEEEAQEEITAFLPTLFTPNGDQENDLFLLRASDIEQIHWMIYNRQGRLVYETKDVLEATQSGWDGSVRGEPQPEDSYIWVVEGSGKGGLPLSVNGRTSGSVTLIR